MFKGASYVFLGSLLSVSGLFSAVPTSTNFTLKAYDFGSGGGSSSSTSYKLDANAGAQGAGGLTSTNYRSINGELVTQNTSVPAAPTLSNPNNYYDRLKLVVNTGNNSTDTRFLIAISSDSFASTQYVQADNSIGANYTIGNYQTYALWGGASGFLILGLSPSTTYQVKVRAFAGNFSESAYSVATPGIATIATTISFSVTTTLAAVPPFTVGFSGLVAGSVFTGDADVLVAISTNAVSGGTVYAQDTNTGLFSSSASYTIASATSDLGAVTSGYGAQVSATAQTSGGPLVSQSPYNGITNNVGQLSTGLRAILASTSAVTTGTATIRLKARTDAITPSSTDYSDSITLIAAMTF